MQNHHHMLRVPCTMVLVLNPHPHPLAVCLVPAMGGHRPSTRPGPMVKGNLLQVQGPHLPLPPLPPTSQDNNHQHMGRLLLMAATQQQQQQHQPAPGSRNQPRSTNSPPRLLGPHHRTNHQPHSPTLQPLHSRHGWMPPSPLNPPSRSWTSRSGRSHMGCSQKRTLQRLHSVWSSQPSLSGQAERCSLTVRRSMQPHSHPQTQTSKRQHWATWGTCTCTSRCRRSSSA